MEVAQKQSIAKLGPFTAKDYKGLGSAIFQFDGIEVGGYGKIKESTTAWTDCIKNVATYSPSKFDFKQNCVYCNKTAYDELLPYSGDQRSAVDNAFAGDKWTLEVTVDCGHEQLGGFYKTDALLSGTNGEFYCWIRWMREADDIVYIYFGIGGFRIKTVPFGDRTKFKSCALVKNGLDAYCYVDGVKVAERHDCPFVYPNLLGGYTYAGTSFMRYSFNSKALSEDDIKMNWLIDKERFGI